MSVVERIAKSYENGEDFNVMEKDVKELEEIHEKKLVYKETLKHIVELGEPHVSQTVLTIVKQALKEEVSFK